MAAPSPLSDILVSDMISELSVNKLFATLTQAQQIALFNSAQQEINGFYIDQGKNEYKFDTLTSAAVVP